MKASALGSNRVLASAFLFLILASSFAFYANAARATSDDAAFRVGPSCYKQSGGSRAAC